LFRGSDDSAYLPGAVLAVAGGRTAGVTTPAR
jgi:hypothetical protein